jgi:Tfp pilus assembly protein PilV
MVKTDTSGMTLIEVMMASLLMIVVLVAAMLFWRYLTQTTAFSFSQSQSVEEAASVVERLARDLRQATVAADGSYPLNLATDNSIAFHADITGDGVAERIRYSLVGTDMERSVITATGNPPQYVAQNQVTTRVASHLVPTQALFGYYNELWPADTITNPLPLNQRLMETRLVTITLVVQQSGESQPVTFSRTITLRGLQN